ncbi:MAG: glycosyltransferase family 2 protein [Clostridia bacterium]|nr:glycosyltransferase family 2 protein [Clostridia bacterium]
MKYIVIENKKTLKEINDFLVREVGFPTIQRRMNIYSVDDDIQIEIANDRVSFRQSSKTKYTYVKNKNLKHFFRFIQDRNENGFYINDIVMLKYQNANLLFETFHGDLLSTDDEELIEKIKNKFKLKVYDDIHDHEEIYTTEPEFLFDEIGNLNSKIKKYSGNIGLDTRSVSSSLRVRISNLSNDYSHVEKYYKLVTNNELLSFDSYTEGVHNFKNISIIIPAYNQDVVPTLLSIQGQNLTKEEKQKIQVVLIDDGSENDILKDINKIRNLLDYELNVISFEKNLGLSNARNVGISVAKHDLLLFMDSDIVLSKNYINDINMRLQVIPNAIFVAMRKNIDKTSPLLKKENLLHGVERSLDLDDSRVITTSKAYHIGWDKVYANEQVSILDDTNNFKELGFGAHIGIYNLATVVTGHNIAVNKKMLTTYPVFSTKFKGWGMEDSYFASQLISKGSFVIPVLSSCVYHIDHPPRSGSMEQKSKEAARNFEIYNQMLDEEWKD